MRRLIRRGVPFRTPTFDLGDDLHLGGDGADAPAFFAPHKGGPEAPVNVDAMGQASAERSSARNTATPAQEITDGIVRSSSALVIV